MSNWYEISVITRAEDEDAAAAALFELGTTGLRTEANDSTSTIFAYFAEALREDDVRDALAGFGVVPTLCRIRALAADEVDWSENWKLHFSPRPVGARFFVCPPWAPEAPTGRLPLVINPGMAFGTGQHATTRGCIELLECATGEASVRSAIDLGTGSGILAIALVRMGVPSVVAIDNDPDARASTTENLDLNGVGEQVTVLDDIDRAHGSFDVIVANLFADLLVEFVPKLDRLAAVDGRILCSGMLESDLERVASAFANAGWRIYDSRSESPWVSIALSKVRP